MFKPTYQRERERENGGERKKKLERLRFERINERKNEKEK